MAWTQLGGSLNREQDDAKVWDWEKNGTLIGIYEQIKNNVGPNASKLHFVRKENGEMVKVWGCAVLDNRLSEIAAGTKIKIEYQGKQLNKNTGRYYRDFLIYADTGVKEEINIDEAFN